MINYAIGVEEAKRGVSVSEQASSAVRKVGHPADAAPSPLFLVPLPFHRSKIEFAHAN